MTVVKTVEFRKNLKEILEKIYNGEEDSFFLDYYGKLFQITPVSASKAKKTTQAKRIVQHFQNRKRHSFADDSVFNEADPAQEKENIRNLMAQRYER